MIKKLDEQKAKVKETLNQEIEEYFKVLENTASQEGFDINAFEQLMLENQKKMKTVMMEANSKIASQVETEEKKTALTAENS